MVEKKLNWWQKPLRLVHLGYSSDIAWNFDAEEYADNISWLGANAVHFEVGWGEPHAARYNSKLLPKDERIGERDILAEVIPALHKRDIHIFAYVNAHVLDDKTLREHPDWIQRKADGSPVIIYERLYSNCINSSWRDLNYGIIRELLEGYEIDGIFLDGPAFYPGSCYCESCQRRFREAFGNSIPEEEDWDNPLWRRFIRWRYECMNEYMKGAKETASSVRRDAPIYMNATGMDFPGPTARYVGDLAKYEDIVGAEAFMYYYTRHLERPLWAQSGTAKYMVAAAKGKPAVVFVTYSVRPWGYRPLPEGDLRLSILQTAINGAGIWLEMGHPVLKYSPEEARVVRDTYGFLREHNDYLEGAVSAANVALLWSRQNGDFSGAVSVERGDWTAAGSRVEARSNRYLGEFKGLYEAMLRAHIPFDIVLDEDLEDIHLLSRYRVIVLGNASCLSDRQIEVLKAFVEAGGGLVASFDTSLYTHDGEIRDNLGLGDVFGIVAKKEIFTPNLSGYLLLQGEHPTIAGVRRLLPAPGTCLWVEVLHPKGVLGHLISPDVGSSVAEQLMRVPDSPFPAIIVNEYGKGRVFYSAGCLGERYWNQPLPEFKEIISNAVNWVSRGEIPVKVEGPETIEVVLTRQTEKSRFILHLLNYTGEMSRPLNNILPLQNITITLNERFFQGVSQIRLVDSDERPLVTSDGHGRARFVLPQLSVYAGVVIEGR